MLAPKSEQLSAQPSELESVSMTVLCLAHPWVLALAPCLALHSGSTWASASARASARASVKTTALPLVRSSVLQSEQQLVRKSEQWELL
jgi:hypothetical protein